MQRDVVVVGDVIDDVARAAQGTEKTKQDKKYNPSFTSRFFIFIIICVVFCARL